MKKRFFASVLSLVMLLSLLPTAAFAADESNTPLPEAVNGVITLNSDVNGTLTVNSNDNITLDLAGHKLTNADSSKDTIEVKMGGTLTVKDSKGGGTVDNKNNERAAIFNEGTVTLNGGTFDRTGEKGSSSSVSGGNSWYTICNHGTMTINAGIVKNTGSFSSMIENGYFSYTGNNSRSNYVSGTNAAAPSLTINGGTFTGGLNTVKNDDGGVLVINNGSFSNTAQASILNWNEATINGGSFTTTSNYNTILNGASLSSVSDHDKGKLTITGGSFTAVNGKDAVKNNISDSSIAISGGTFSSDVAEAYLASGCSTVEIGGKHVVTTSTDAEAQIGANKFNTVENAFAAAQANDTVTLLKDATVENALRTTANLTVDLGGHTLAMEKQGFALATNADTTIKNGSIRGTYYGLCVNAGTVTLENVNINTASFAICQYGDSTLTVDKNSSVISTAYVPIFVQGTGTAGDDNCKAPTLNIYGTVSAQTTGNDGYQAISTNGLDYSKPVINIYDGAKITSKNATAMYIPNVGTVNISGGTISGPSSAIAIKCGTLNISGGTLTATGPDSTPTEGWSNGVNASGAAIQIESNTDYKVSASDLGAVNVAITGGTITSENGVAIYEYIGKGNDTQLKGLTISNAYLSGKKDCFMVSDKVGESQDKVIKISSGLFSSDPSAYCVDSLTGVANPDSSTNSKYPFTVDEAKATAAQVAAGAPAVTLPDALKDNKTAQAAQTALAGGTDATPATITGAGIEAAAKEIANDNADVAASYVDKLKEVTSNNDLVANDINIVVQHYMDIAVAAATDADITAGTPASLTLNIKPMAQKVATTANPAGTDESKKEIILDASGDSSKMVNAVKIGSPVELKVTGSVTLTLPLPTDFVGTNSTMYVQHKGYEYEATVLDSQPAAPSGTSSTTDTKSIQFENPHGFSAFIIKASSDAVAKIGDTSYTTLQAAVDAVENNQTITLLKDGEATVSRTVTFSIAPQATTGQEAPKATINEGSRTTVTKSDPVDGVTTYTCTRSSGSDGGVTTYTITTNSPANGTVTASPKSAAKGATVTLTVTPAEGYQLDKLTVADKDGKEITLTDKGNGKYTFTMPASKVEVTATFKQAPVVHVCPAEKYTDVDTTQWYHEGVDYVIANGMMNGTGTNIFEPNATTTRGMIVTILYRLEKEPAAGTSPFTDVDADQWYAKAVAWAAANGVVNGTSSTTFNPNDPITREQMAAILYRYASFKGYDVTGKADLAGYTDASQISAYAKDAMSWANKAGLIGGVSATTLQPQGSATRAQVATILMRFCENVAK